MRFQTISIIAIGAIGLGAVGIINSQAIDRMFTWGNAKKEQVATKKKEVKLVQVDRNYTAGDFINIDDLKAVTKSIENTDTAYDTGYLTGTKDLVDGTFITVGALNNGDYLKKNNIKRLGEFEGANLETRDVVLTVGTELVTKVEPGLYDLYWYFKTDNGDREIKKLKKFAINVFIRSRDADKEDAEIESSDSSSSTGVEVIAKVRTEDVDKYLQAMQDGNFKLLETTSNIDDITNKTYTKLVVTTSKEIQSNDISKSYKYNISVIKG